MAAHSLPPSVTRALFLSANFLNFFLNYIHPSCLSLPDVLPAPTDLYIYDYLRSRQFPIPLPPSVSSSSNCSAFLLRPDTELLPNPIRTTPRLTNFGIAWCYTLTEFNLIGTLLHSSSPYRAKSRTTRRSVSVSSFRTWVSSGGILSSVSHSPLV